MNDAALTPMIRQYRSIKEKHADALLFYRMGDFYEMFFEDAQIASRVLEITLTSRNKKEANPVPMCGVPAKAVQGYIGRLIENGFKVAVCDQTEDPALSKGLVKRDVVRVITPGMIIEDEYLDRKSNNYILAVAKNRKAFGLSCLDISTGTFRVTESEDLDAVADEALRISPREVLLAQSLRQDPSLSPIVGSVPENAVTCLEDRVFEHRSARERLVAQLKTVTLEGFGCETMKAGVMAAGALLFYVGQTQKQKIEHLSRIETYRLDHYLLVDELSCRNLELLKNIRTGSRQGTLIDVIDRTVTPMGGRLLKMWLRYPLRNEEEIRKRLDAVEEARKNPHVRRSLREHLKAVADLERIQSKVSLGHANARDLLALAGSLGVLPQIQESLSVFGSSLLSFETPVEELLELADRIRRAIREDAPLAVNEGGLIQPGYNQELDELVRIGRDGKSNLARLEAKEKEETGISTLKVGYNRVFGYYIEVSKGQSKAVPLHYARKQTLVNAERYVTEELKNFESMVLGAQERRTSLEYEIFAGIRKEAAGKNSAVQEVAGFLARLDCLLSLSEIADANDYVRPELNDSGEIVIEDGRHPVVEKVIAGERFVPNSIRLDDAQNQILMITGPNMAGKSTLLRQVALLVILAQMGSFVPATRASVCAADRIFTRVGALDNLSQGQSTFMVEMEETANILNHATDKSLVIMDEIGRGTSTYDGLSIAWAVAEYLHDLKGKGVKTLFATHYHELTDLARTRSRVKNFNIAVKEWNEEIIFLRKLAEGGANRSYGIEVARLAGIPRDVIARAKKILFRIESGEYGSNGLPRLSPEENGKKKGQIQLSLFRKPEEIILGRLREMDISRMTPLDAINCLHELQERAGEA